MEDVVHNTQLNASRLADLVRRDVIEQSYRAGVGHIGSALSVADLISAIYSSPLLRDVSRESKFVLSKGHAALALYSVLTRLGLISEDVINTYCSDDSRLGVHPENSLEGIDFCTGSLGQGLSIGVGAALAKRLASDSGYVVVLASDAELNEGSVWEAAMFAGHHRLDNLTAVFDINGQQALGYTDEVLDSREAPEMFRLLGWRVAVVDGHDMPQLLSELQVACSSSPQPTALFARTTFGHGVSFMESRIEWHYLPLTDDQYLEALEEIKLRSNA